MQADVEGGASLADAMQKRPHAFDALYTNMVAAGEAGGILDTILKRLSTFIEKQAKLISQVRSAMIYPIAVLSIAVIVVMVILWKVIPTFTALFEGLNAPLPLSTRVVIWMSKELIVGAAVHRRRRGAVRLLRSAATTRRRTGACGWTACCCACRSSARSSARWRWRGSAGRWRRCISSGVPILDGLDITAKTSGNAVIEAAVTQVRGRIERGETIAQPLRNTGVFPPMVSQMIGAGESTGALDAMLAKIAEFYEDEVDVAVAGLLTILEPALICVLGIIVGGIVISMYMPLFDLISQLS